MNNDAPVTKAELKADLTILKDDLLQQFSRQFSQLSRELKEYIDGRSKELREYIDERTHDAETRLLRAFSDYQTSQDVRFRRLKADVGNIDSSTDLRLTALEDRLTNMDKRLIQKGL